MCRRRAGNAQVRSMVRDMEALQTLKDGSVEQAAKLTQAGHKLASLIGDNLSTDSTKTTIEWKRKLKNEDELVAEER